MKKIINFLILLAVFVIGVFLTKNIMVLFPSIGNVVFDGIHISGDSMYPTLVNDEHIWAWDVKNTKPEELEVGDVIIYDLSMSNLTDNTKNLYDFEGEIIIKRIEKIEDVDNDGVNEYYLSGDNAAVSFDSSYIDEEKNEDLGFGWVEETGVLKVIDEDAL